MVAIAKAECGKRGKTRKAAPTKMAMIRSERGKSEKSKAFFSASIRTTPAAERP